jgi:hypothetical protein
MWCAGCQQCPRYKTWDQCKTQQTQNGRGCCGFQNQNVSVSDVSCSPIVHDLCFFVVFLFVNIELCFVVVMLGCLGFLLLFVFCVLILFCCFCCFVCLFSLLFVFCVLIFVCCCCWLCFVMWCVNVVRAGCQQCCRSKTWDQRKTQQTQNARGRCGFQKKNARGAVHDLFFVVFCVNVMFVQDRRRNQNKNH